MKESQTKQKSIDEFQNKLTNLEKQNEQLQNKVSLNF